MKVAFPSRHDLTVGQSYRVLVSGVPGLYLILEKRATGEDWAPWEYVVVREAPMWRN